MLSTLSTSRTDAPPPRPRARLRRSRSASSVASSGMREASELQVSLIGGALNSSRYDVCAAHVALSGGLGQVGRAWAGAAGRTPHQSVCRERGRSAWAQRVGAARGRSAWARVGVMHGCSGVAGLPGSAVLVLAVCVPIMDRIQRVV